MTTHDWIYLHAQVAAAIDHATSPSAVMLINESRVALYDAQRLVEAGDLPLPERRMGRFALAGRLRQLEDDALRAPEWARAAKAAYAMDADEDKIRTHRLHELCAAWTARELDSGVMVKVVDGAMVSAAEGSGAEAACDFLT